MRARNRVAHGGGGAGTGHSAAVSGGGGGTVPGGRRGGDFAGTRHFAGGDTAAELANLALHTGHHCGRGGVGDGGDCVRVLPGVEGVAARSD